MRPKIISVINFCWAEREDKNIHSAGVNITQSRQRVGVICHWRRDSEAAGEPSPGFHLVSQAGATGKAENSTTTSTKSLSAVLQG